MNDYRDVSIDILRGLAIFTMVAANTAPYVLMQPHPFWLRLYGSFAAPLFILIAGMMVAFTAQTKGHNLKYFLARGAMLIATGALVDVLIWKIYPFFTVDVLYLIGLSLPLAYLFRYLKPRLQWLAIVFIFLLTPILQKLLGYTNYPTEIYLWGEPTVVVENQTNVFNHWIVDGWFPIFPWLGFSLLGVVLAKLRWRDSSAVSFGKSTALLIGICILAVGIIIWWFYPGRLLIREGYSELFYPPTIGYVMTAIGVVVILFFVVDSSRNFVIWKPLETLGQSSLFIYILHLTLVEYVITPICSEQSLLVFLAVYCILVFFLALLAYELKILKRKWTGRPFIVRFFLGG